MITYFITEIVRILQGSVIPIALLVIAMNSLIVTQECKSWIKRMLFVACVSTGYMIIGEFVEPYIMSATDYVTGLISGSIAMTIVGLVLYMAVHAALAMGYITGMRVALSSKNNRMID